MTVKYDSCKDGRHVYKENVCILCGHRSDQPSKRIHGRYVCEECVQYVCSDDYKNEPPKKIRKSRSKSDTAQKRP